MTSKKPIRTLLVANRGEIASRVFRTCRRMGIRTVAVYSDADRDAPFVGQADQAIRIGEAAPSASYLNVDAVLEAARQSGADAVHPGYGFLSENAAFARRCAEAGLIWIGPNPDAIDAMGSKSRAKAIMQEHGVPTVPGYQGDDQSDKRLLAEAEKVGYPLLVKAAAGGGGKGMRIVHGKAELQPALDAAKREAKSAFGDDELILERYVESGRHVEFQIFGDQHGNAIHLLERECSIQRRYQKVLEESPSPALTPAVRDRMGQAAVQAAKALQYDNAGTVEFMLEGSGDDASFYFLEVNTRLQVEHPVTEMVTGLDLVQWQIETAEGRPLPLTQDAVQGKGYAVECRLYAEDTAKGFLPVTGTIQRWEIPTVEGLRVESAVQSGSVISVHYDPMIAKLIVHDRDRASAHRKMAYVLRHLVCLGSTTNQDFLRRLVEDPDFQAGDYDTGFLDAKPSLATPQSVPQSASLSTKPSDGPSAEGQETKHTWTAPEAAALAACLHGWWQRDQARVLLASLPSGWSNNPYGPVPERYDVGEETVTISYQWQGKTAAVNINEQEANARIVEASTRHIRLELDGQQSTWHIDRRGLAYWLQHPAYGTLRLQEQERFPVRAADKAAGGYDAPMPSQVLRVLVSAGQAVKKGTPLLVLSSMKMENTVYAEEAGTVEAVYAEANQNVEAGFTLLRIKTENAVAEPNESDAAQTDALQTGSSITKSDKNPS